MPVESKKNAFQQKVLAVYFMALLTTVSFSYELVSTYMNSIGREIVTSWIDSETIDIQENNLLSAVTKSQRVLLSSNFIKGVAVLEKGQLNSVPLAEFGEPVPFSQNYVPATAETAEVFGISAFRKVITYRFSGGENLVLAFLIDSNFVRVFFLIAAFSLLIFLSAIFSLIRLFERQKAAFELEGKIRLGELAAQIAHDIGTPLSVLNSLLSIDEEVDRNLIRDEVLRTQNLMSKLLRRYRGENEIEADEVFDLVSLVRSQMQTVEIYSGNTCTVSLSTSHEQIFIKAQKSEIDRAILNILKNSIEASPGVSAKIKISLNLENDSAELLIQDNGVGISPENLERIFIKDVSTKKNGTGLGLYQAWNAIKANGGLLTVDSIVGRGTTMRLSLSAIPAPKKELSENRPHLTELVFIDDSKANRKLWEIQAKRVGARIKTFESENEFLGCAHELSKSTPIYIDYAFGEDLIGGEIALRMDKLGFTEIYLASEYQHNLINAPSCIRKIVTKEFPIKL